MPDDGPAPDPAPGPRDGAPAPPTRLTRRQRLVRGIFRVLGPAQVGPPPYATPEELAAHRRANRPLPPPAASSVPPGYRLVSYRDESGTLHRSLVPEEPPTPQ